MQTSPRKSWWPIATAIVLGVAILVAILLYAGVLGPAYEWLWRHTTGRPWTYIMRENGWLLIVPAVAIMSSQAKWLPYRRWSRVVLITSTLIMGIVFGHVFW